MSGRLGDLASEFREAALGLGGGLAQSLLCFAWRQLAMPQRVPAATSQHRAVLMQSEKKGDPLSTNGAVSYCRET